MSDFVTHKQNITRENLPSLVRLVGHVAVTMYEIVVSCIASLNRCIRIKQA